jgi:hypothetical protein
MNSTQSSTVAPSDPRDTQLSGTTNQTKCFANNHMTWAEFGFYTACKSLANAGPAGFLYLNGPDLALLAKANSTESSKRSSKTTVYKYAKALERLGFFVLKKASTKDDKGKNTSTVYSVLEHDQWAKLHPGVCNKIQCQIREEKENHQDQLLNSPRPIIELTKTNSCPDQDQELVTIFIPTTHTEFTYKPLPTNPAPIVGNGTLDADAGDLSGDARESVPTASPKLWTGQSAESSPPSEGVGLVHTPVGFKYADALEGSPIREEDLARLVAPLGLERRRGLFFDTSTKGIVPFPKALALIQGTERRAV